MVCHNGETWLPRALEAVEASTIRPRHILAVDTGSTDGTAGLLEAAAAEDIVDGVLTLAADTGFAAAVHHAVEHAGQRWGDAGPWIWLLHDDSAPEPECLDILLRAAEAAPSAGVLGPLALDWTDERLIVEAGLSIDASGHRQPGALAGGGYEQSTEVLAVPSAGVLISSELWTEIGGFDRALPMLREDTDFGWRANAADSLVLCVPAARIRHACAVSGGKRRADALSTSVEAADRAHGLRTFLVNCAPLSFVFGIPRLVLLCLLRGLAFALVRNGPRAHAEFAAIGYLLGGRGGLRAARSGRSTAGGSVRGLFTGRLTRLRGAVGGTVLRLVRSRVASEAALGRLPESTDGATAWKPPPAGESDAAAGRPIGPAALPAGSLRPRGARAQGLRKPATVLAVELPERPAGRPGPRPSPGRAREEFVFVEVDRRRVLAATLFAPPVVLFVVLSLLAVIVHAGRLGLDLSGGALRPVGSLGELWSAYLSTWHPGSGGTATAAPVTFAVLGLLGAPLAPLGGAAALVALLLLGNAPIAALTAYAAARRIRVRRWVKAGAAAAYALLPAATAGVAQGRLDLVVAHILLPPVVAGIVAVLTRAERRWLSVAVLTSLAVAVLGAFAPVAHALALAGLLLGYLVLPSAGRQARRVAAVALVALLPLLLLLPWLPALLTHRTLFFGPAAPSASAAELLGLAPGGPGAWPIGIALVAAAVVAFVFRPTARVLPGVALAVLGLAGLGLVRLAGQGASAGVPLLLVGAGLLWAFAGVWTAVRDDRGRTGAAVPRLAVAGGAAVLLALVAGAAVEGREGPLRDGTWTLASSLTAELAGTGRSVLVLGDQPEQSSARPPHYGDAALVPPPATPVRLAGWQRSLLTGTAEEVRAAAGYAAAGGVLFVVLPEGSGGSAGEAVRGLAGDLIAAAPPTSDGRPVLRLTPTGGQVALVSPEQARRSVTGMPPVDATAVSPVDARPPDVRVRVSDGPEGRLLVLAAEEEAGWRASVDGEAVPIVRSWGHQVAVAVPPRQSAVVVEHVQPARGILLLGQVAAVLFTALTAIPGRRRTERA
ncbi:glycosyl transferase [Amycolatopsis antarctica]|uniref:Glycosyl transferase n=1 Tax=Amycolatopsis antarctica TaxID=1854586 RepID=A0A263D5R0_9PSEU|nr:glycosyl transferase [Amycolatopsis antarctica]